MALADPWRGRSKGDAIALPHGLFRDDDDTTQAFSCGNSPVFGEGRLPITPLCPRVIKASFESVSGAVRPLKLKIRVYQW